MATVTGKIMAPANSVMRKAVKAHWNVLKSMIAHFRQPGDCIVFDGDIRSGQKYDIALSMDPNGYEQIHFTPKP